MQWVVTAYAITFGGLLVLGGRAADLFGRRRLFMAGLAGFAVASAAAGVATSLPFLVVARAVQGVAAAAVAPAALSILTTTFPDGPVRTRVLGYYGTMASVGFVGGLVLGGVLVETAGWRGVFFVNVPVCLIGVALTRRVVYPSVPTSTPRHLDLTGGVLVTAGVALLVYAAYGRRGYRLDVKVVHRGGCHRGWRFSSSLSTVSVAVASPSCQCRFSGLGRWPQATA